MNNFPHSSVIDIESRSLFEAAYKNLPPSVSDLVFANLYCWQDIYPYRISSIGNLLLVHYREEDTVTFLPPLLLDGRITDKGFAGSLAFAAECVSGFCEKEGLKAVFRFLPELYLRHLKKGMFVSELERDCFDYVYRKKDLAGLLGRDYAPKRNLIRQFEKSGKFEYGPLTPDNAAQVRRLLEKDPNKTDTKVVERMIRDFDKLGLTGGIIRSGQDIVAATIASVSRGFMYKKACHDMCVVHFEKALKEHKGAYQAVNKYFSASLPENVNYINREEDLGLEGLRKAKLSYAPDRLIEKYKLLLPSKRLTRD